jgi:hypothetical protein
MEIFQYPEISSTANISTDGKILLFTILNGPQLQYLHQTITGIGEGTRVNEA